MAKLINFIYNGDSFNVNYDLTWSFKFALCGASLTESQAGFTTFLTTIPTVIGGGYYNNLGYTGSPPLSGGLLAIGFDTYGSFAFPGDGFDGVSYPNIAKNSLIIRGSSPACSLLYNIPLSSLSTEFKLLSNQINFCWLRFRLGDVCSRIYIDYRYGDSSNYTQLTSLPISINFSLSTEAYVGISYTSPVVTFDLLGLDEVGDFLYLGLDSGGDLGMADEIEPSIDPTSILQLKNFNIEGGTILPTTTSYTQLTNIGETIFTTQTGVNVEDFATQDEHIILT
jgi:hypothetical protein